MNAFAYTVLLWFLYAVMAWITGKLDTRDPHDTNVFWVDIMRFAMATLLLIEAPCWVVGIAACAIVTYEGMRSSSHFIPPMY